MAKMLDSEGVAIPTEDGSDLFDISIVHWDSKNPELSMSVPQYFEVDGGRYESHGVLYVSINDVMEEYLDDILAIDGGERAGEFADYLEDYAKRLRAKVGI